ncbi:MAG: ATP-binding cassette domain-containing protein [Aestuariivirga sp.]|nr:ATP-binding cassette domain-containing protein [Aestuariivirga sp.]
MAKAAPPKRALLARDLHKSFGGLEILKGVTVEAHKGEAISIPGASGSGRSAFLCCINFLKTGDAGHMEVNGIGIDLPGPPSGRAGKEKVLSLRRSTGFILRSFNLWSRLIVTQNLHPSWLRSLWVRSSASCEDWRRRDGRWWLPTRSVLRGMSHLA